MNAPVATPSTVGADVARISALLNAIGGLVRDLEDHVAAHAFDGYYLITALEVCVSQAQAHAAAAIDVLPWSGGLNP